MEFERKTTNVFGSSLCREAVYANDYPQLKAEEILSKFLLGERTGDNSVMAGLEDLFLIKSQVWAYEKEWRIIYPEADLEIYQGQVPVSGIVFGMEATQQTIKSVLEAVGSLSPLNVYQVKRKDNYNLEMVPLPLSVTLVSSPNP
jgi:hypothetical protein